MAIFFFCGSNPGVSADDRWLQGAGTRHGQKTETVDLKAGQIGWLTCWKWLKVEDSAGKWPVEDSGGNDGGEGGTRHIDDLLKLILGDRPIAVLVHVPGPATN